MSIDDVKSHYTRINVEMDFDATVLDVMTLVISTEDHSKLTAQQIIDAVCEAVLYELPDGKLNPNYSQLDS